MRQYLTDGKYDSDGEDKKLLRKHNLTGLDVVVGIGDTGIDDKSAFFFDSANDVAYNKKTLDPNHRKIAMYYVYGTKGDETTDGHGTHVAGMVVGDAQTSTSRPYNVRSLLTRITRRESRRRRASPSSISKTRRSN